MPDRTVDPVHVPFTITTTAGTAINAPRTTALAVPRGTLLGIDLLIPPGHRGLTGIRFTLANQQIFPWSNTVAWLIGDDLKETFTTDVYVDTQLAAVTYNTGTFDHAHLFRLVIRQVEPTSGTPTLTLIDNTALHAS